MLTNEQLKNLIATDDEAACCAFVCLVDDGQLRRNSFIDDMVARIVSYYSKPEGERRFPRALTPSQVNALRRDLRNIGAIALTYRPVEGINWKVVGVKLGVPDPSAPKASATPDFACDGRSVCDEDAATDEELASEFMGVPSGLAAGQPAEPAVNEKLKPLTAPSALPGSALYADTKAEMDASIAHFGSLANHKRLHPKDFKGNRLIPASEF